LAFQIKRIFPKPLLNKPKIVKPNSANIVIKTTLNFITFHS
jgi:hypothetical protein